MSTYPLLTIDLNAVAEYTRLLATRLLAHGYTLIGVTKALDGEPCVGREMLEAGCAGLADSRLSSLKRLAADGLAPLTLIRPPQQGELADVAAVADRVMLSDVGAARILGEHASGAPIDVLLTVDLGDRREGVLPSSVPRVAAQLSRLPGIQLAGLSVNFGCFCGQLPSVALLHQAEEILAAVAGECGGEPLLSLGGTCVLQHLDGFRPRFATEIRCGGALLYGWDFVSMAPIDGMIRTDPVLSATVLECGRKPPVTLGEGRDAFGHVPEVDLPTSVAYYSLLDIGRRDCEPRGMRPLMSGAHFAGATSDVGVLVSDAPLQPGELVSFAVDYDALVRAVTSPFVHREFVHGGSPWQPSTVASAKGRP
jgi:predicted amino acid racemase